MATWTNRDRGFLLAAFFNCGVSNGIAQAFSVLFVVLLEDLGTSRSTTAGIFSIAMLTMGVTAILAGAALSRIGPRALMIGGCLCVGAGLGLSGLTRSVTGLYITYGVVTAAGLGVLSWIVQGAMISPWFPDRRGTATGVAFAGMGFGVLVAASTTQFLIDRVGWRLAVAILGAGVAVLGIVINALLVPAQPVVPASSRGWRDTVSSLLQALSGRAFWCFLGVLGLTSLANYAVAGHQAAHIVDVGFAPWVASTIVAASGLLSSVGRVLFGTGADRFGRLPAATASYFGSIAGLLLLLVISPTFPWTVAGYGLLFGITFGARGPILASMVAEEFNHAGYGAIWGAISVGNSLGSAFGPWVAGVAFDRTGSYTTIFFAAMVALAVSNLLLAIARSGRGGSLGPHPWRLRHARS